MVRAPDLATLAPAHLVSRHGAARTAARILLVGVTFLAGCAQPAPPAATQPPAAPTTAPAAAQPTAAPAVAAPKPTAAAAPAPTAVPAAQAGPAREIVVAIGGESKEGYDPTLGWGRYGSPIFQSTLLKRDQNLKIANDLAEAVKVSDDKLTWTVTIRKDAKFSDGQPLTAKDVAYTFTKAAASAGKTDVTNLAEARATSDYEVQLKLKQPQSTFVNRLATLGVVPEEGHNDGYAKSPIGSGPYKLVRWDQGQQLIVEASLLYYGPKPQFTCITFLFTSEDAASLTMAKAGKVQSAAVPSSLATQHVPNMKLIQVKSVDNRGMLFPTQPAGSKTSSKGHPVGNDVTNDPAIRKAVNFAVDRKVLVAGVLEGYGSPAFAPASGTPWDQPQAAIQDANVDEAKKILAEAGIDGVGLGALRAARLRAGGGSRRYRGLPGRPRHPTLRLYPCLHTDVLGRPAADHRGGGQPPGCAGLLCRAARPAAGAGQHLAAAPPPAAAGPDPEHHRDCERRPPHPS